MTGDTYIPPGNKLLNLFFKHDTNICHAFSFRELKTQRITWYRIISHNKKESYFTLVLLLYILVAKARCTAALVVQSNNKYE